MNTAASPLIFATSYCIPISMKQFDPRRLECEPYGFACACWEPTMMPRPDKRTEVELHYFERGQCTLL